MSRRNEPTCDSTVETARPDTRPDISPFPWSELSSIEAETVALENRLLRLLPGARADRPVLQSVADRLTELTGAEHALEVHRCRFHHNVPDLTFGDAFVTRLQLPPDSDIGALVIDLPLVERWIETMPEAKPRRRRVGELDDRDFGLATYVCLQILDHLKSTHGAPPVVLPTEPPLEDLLTDRLCDADRLAEVVFTVTTVGRRHLARLLISEGLLRNLQDAGDHPAGRRLTTAPLLDGPLADTHLEFPAVLGTTRLRVTEYRQLARGDVVLLREHGLLSSPEAEDGQPPAASLRLADTHSSTYLPGHILPEPGRWKFRLATTTPRTTSNTMTSPNENDTDTPGTSSETLDDTALLEAPETTLEVRLGSVTLSLRELGELGTGQVLTLDRRVGADAELVVDGRVVGRGELVDVEGEIGVRIRHIDQ